MTSSLHKLKEPLHAWTPHVILFVHDKRHSQARYHPTPCPQPPPKLSWKNKHLLKIVLSSCWEIECIPRARDAKIGIKSPLSPTPKTLFFESEQNYSVRKSQIQRRSIVPEVHIFARNDERLPTAYAHLPAFLAYVGSSQWNVSTRLVGYRTRSQRIPIFACDDLRACRYWMARL